MKLTLKSQRIHGGIDILHQYARSSGPTIDTIPWKYWKGREQEAGSRYYTIDY